MTPGLWLLVGGITLVTLGYAGLCYEKPFGKCLACRLTPADHVCRRCRGTTYRPRIFWQIWNWIVRQRGRSHTHDHIRDHAGTHADRTGGTGPPWGGDGQ